MRSSAASLVGKVVRFVQDSGASLVEVTKVDGDNAYGILRNPGGIVDVDPGTATSIFLFNLDERGRWRRGYRVNPAQLREAIDRKLLQGAEFTYESGIVFLADATALPDGWIQGRSVERTDAPVRVDLRTAKSVDVGQYRAGATWGIRVGVVVLALGALATLLLNDSEITFSSPRR